MAEPGPPLRVGVVCAWPGRVWLRELRLPPGSTVADALAASRWQEELALREGLPAAPKVGIFGRLVAPATPLRDGDRVELYRPLQADPVSLRRQRAAGARDAGSA